jgi:hypothetical protein
VQGAVYMTNPTWGELSESETLSRQYHRIAIEIEAVLLQYPQGIAVTELVKGICEHFKCTEVVARVALQRTDTYVSDGMIFLRNN